MPCDVVVAGAGPAGALCATILARAGLNVEIFDRAEFPRDKLCGDTLNPGALRALEQYIPIDAIIERSLPLDGMVLTGPGAAVRGAYGTAVHGRAIVRRDLDDILLAEAIKAGAQFSPRTTIIAPLAGAENDVAGIVIRSRDGQGIERRARYVVAADGRESRLARTLGLAQHARQPRRWAIGGYFQGAEIDRHYGEMHVRQGRYIGVAPVPGDLANVCLVVPHVRGDGGWRDAAALLCDSVQRDSRLHSRFARATLIGPPRVLGPMAVDARGCGVPGLVLAGDAAGFIDPITGDGLRLALDGAALAAGVVLDVFAGRCTRHHAATLLEARRRQAFAAKWRFNRAIRALVAAPAAVAGAAVAARVCPGAFAAVIRYAGDTMEVQSSKFKVQS